MYLSLGGAGAIQDKINILREACLDRNRSTEDVNTAISSLESPSSDLKVCCTDMKGKWELVYSSLIPNGYFPVREICDFYGYTLVSSFGILPLGRFRGDSKVLSETKPAVIEFNTNIYKLGPLVVDSTKKNKDKPARTYTFLYVDNEVAVARSSTGGGTLLKRVTE